jgi:hypothetical protein
MNISHMKKRILSLAVAMPWVWAQAAHAVMPSGLATVPAGQTLLLTGQAVEPAVYRSMTGYVNGVGQVPAGFSFYLILDGDVLRTRRDLATIQSFMSRYPGTIVHLALGIGPGIAWNGRHSALLLAGRYDAELKSISQWLRSVDHPVFLRPLYEFDRWCNTYGTGTTYQRAYRYMADRLRPVANNNVALVWHSAGPGVRLGGACPLSTFYPGDKYVDYFATSYFTKGPSDTAFHKELDELLTEARAFGKPLMIGEATASVVGSASGQPSLDWLNNFFDIVEKHDIRAVHYIAAEWSKEGNAWPLISALNGGLFPPETRVHAEPRFLATWKQRTALPRYVNASGAPGLLGYQSHPEPLPWAAKPEAERQKTWWPFCPLGTVPGTGGWCLRPVF